MTQASYVVAHTLLLLMTLALSACENKQGAPADKQATLNKTYDFKKDDKSLAAVGAEAPPAATKTAPANQAAQTLDLSKLFAVLGSDGGLSSSSGGIPNADTDGLVAPSTIAPPPPPATKNGHSAPSAKQQPITNDAQTQAKRIDDYLNGLRSAAYAFNPPSPIKIAKPVTIYFWLDPNITTAQLAEALRKTVPRDAERIESGKTVWSPTMRATLSGPDFNVSPVPGNPEEQPVSATQRTTWSWDVTPLHPGDSQVLHLRLQVVLPDGQPKTVTTLDREIRVDVTIWWLFDNFFDKYWKWLLGGLGTALSAIIAWWWNKRRNVGKRPSA